MNAKTIAALAIVAIITGLDNRVKAQSPRVPSSNTGQYTLSGDSLEGINNRTAENDFVIFFNQQKRVANGISNNFSENIVYPYLEVWQMSDRVQLRRADEPPPPKSTSSIIFQPAQSINGNDGFQLQLDVRQ